MRDLGAQIEGSGGGQQFGCAVSAALLVVPRRHIAVAFGFENYSVSTPMTKHSFCVLDYTRQMKAKAPGQH